MLEAAARGSPMKLVAGKGDDPDTLSTAEIFVMDSDQFPFYPAEQYHQFHNDFQDPPMAKPTTASRASWPTRGTLARPAAQSRPFDDSNEIISIITQRAQRTHDNSIATCAI